MQIIVPTQADLQRYGLLAWVDSATRTKALSQKSGYGAFGAWLGHIKECVLLANKELDERLYLRGSIPKKRAGKALLGLPHPRFAPPGTII